MSMPDFYEGAQNQTHKSKCGFTRAEEREIIASLNLLVTLFLMHPRKLSCGLLSLEDMHKQEVSSIWYSIASYS